MKSKHFISSQHAKVRTVRSELEQSLPYQLGSLILHLRHFRTWPMIPATLRKIARARRGRYIAAEDVRRYARSDVLRKWLSQAPPVTVYRCANMIAEDSGWAMAAAFIEKYERPGYESAVHLFRANQHLEDDALWLAELNAYLEPCGLSPVLLADTPGSRFSRLHGAPTAFIESGELVTVIMPVFNAAATLKYAANSILAQTWRNLELIIVDDCSNDGSWEVMQALAVADPRVRILKNAVNVGPYVSKNLALRIAKGRYLTGHDADDWAHPERLENDLAVIQKSGGRILAVLSGMLRMDETGEFCGFHNKLGANSEDGVSRSAAISLLVDVDYFRTHLGAWDSVRFSADGEIISRARRIMGSRFQILSHHIGMIVLDHPTSLSNDPVHGFTKATGKSLTRRKYGYAYEDWHSKMRSAEAFMAFPHVDRKFSAPDVMRVPTEAIQANIAAHQEQSA